MHLEIAFKKMSSRTVSCFFQLFMCFNFCYVSSCSSKGRIWKLQTWAPAWRVSFFSWCSFLSFLCSFLCSCVVNSFLSGCCHFHFLHCWLIITFYLVFAIIFSFLVHPGSSIVMCVHYVSPTFCKFHLVACACFACAAIVYLPVFSCA